MNGFETTPALATSNGAPSPSAVGDPSDRDLAHWVLQAIHAVQEALDSAALAGLILEPQFKSYPNRFKDRGSSAESYVASVEVYRKLV